MLDRIRLFHWRGTHPAPFFFVLLSLCGQAAHAQATVKTDGQWRALFTLGGSYASGNSKTTSLNVDGEVVRATEADKWLINGRALYTTNNNNNTTAEQGSVGTRYDRTLDAQWFAFGQLIGTRDRPANLNLRTSTSAGGGLHMIETETLKWDALFGAGYTYDRYVRPKQIAGQIRQQYGRVEGLLGEESVDQLTDKAKFRQKITLFPNFSHLQSSRAVVESSVSAPLTGTLSLTASLVYRYDNDPGPGLSRHDTLFVTGVSLRMD